MALFGRKNGKADFSNERSVTEYLTKTASEKDSAVFREVINALNDLNQQQKVSVSPESAQKVVLANARLIKACETYMDSRKGTVTDRGKERLEAVTKLCEQRKERNLDQMRDMREVNKHLGQKWEDVKVSIPVVELKSGAEVVGSNVNKRVKTEYNGKTGFFTERKELLLWQEQMAELIGNESDPRRKDIYERNREWLEKKLAPVTQDTNPLKSLDIRPEFSMRFRLADTWQNMDMSDPQFGILRELVGQAPDKTAQTLVGYQNEAKRLDEDDSLSPADREARKIEAFQAQVRRHIPEEYQQRLTGPEGGTRQFFMEFASSFEPEKRNSLLELASIRADLIEEKARLNENTVEGSMRAVAINNFVRDEKVLKDCADTIRTLASADTAMGVANLKRGKTDELTDRNVATSRIAELLGVGSIVAHSEKMIVKSGDKTIEGCFMEFAEGKDFSSTKEADMRMVAEKLDFSGNPSFYKDQSDMEMLDYLCGQNDRNPANLFYKLSEPGPDGKRNIIGLQGIDNDLAFGATGARIDDDGKIVVNETQMRGQLTPQGFIDKHMAEAVQSLDREKLEFALGDLLPESYIDIMWERTKFAQKHIRENAIVIEGEEWNLDKYNLEEYLIPIKETTPEKRDLFRSQGKAMGMLQANLGKEFMIDTEKLLELKESDPEKYKYVWNLWDREVREDAGYQFQHHKYNGVLNKIHSNQADLAAMRAKDEQLLDEVAPAMEAMFDESKTKPVRKEISFKDFQKGAVQLRQPRKPRPEGPVIGVHEKKGPVQEQTRTR